MKKNIVLIMFLVIIVSLCGCTKKDEEISGGNANNENEIVLKRSNNEMYQVYSNKFQDVKNLFSDLGLSCEETLNSSYNGPICIAYTDHLNDREGAITSADYQAVIYEGNIEQILARININVDDLKYIEGEFKFEDTIFNKLRQIVLSNPMNYEEINLASNNYYKENGDYLIIIEDDYVKETLQFGYNNIYYTIKIIP